jgi:hypothetical protein
MNIARFVIALCDLFARADLQRLAIFPDRRSIFVVGSKMTMRSPD